MRPAGALVLNAWNTRVFQAEHRGVPNITPGCSKRNTSVSQSETLYELAEMPDT